MKNLLALSAAALCLALSAPAFAQTKAPMAGASAPAATGAPMTGATMTKAEAKAANKKADADYKAAKKACKPMKGAEQKTCMKDAKDAHKKTEAEIKAAKK
jgi:hypothetical protein